jgi:hypothetical protein
MMAFSRLAYVCKVPTQVTTLAVPDAEGTIPVRTGTEADIDRLPDEMLTGERRERLRQRLVDGEIFVIGELSGRIVSFTWLRPGGMFSLLHLPEHSYRLGAGVGYGYDAWTDPSVRGRGLRQAVFAEELRILARLGFGWEVSYFVGHQLEGGRRTLARIGVPLTPLWEVRVQRNGTLALTALRDDDAVTPCFEYAQGEKVVS